MEKEELLKMVSELENELNDLTSKVTDEEIKNATKEEKLNYLKIISEIKTKIEILKSL